MASVAIVLGEVKADLDPAPNPSGVVGASPQWSDASDATYAAINPNTTTNNGFAYAPILSSIGDGDLSVTVRLAIPASPYLPGQATSVQPLFSVLVASDLTRAGARGPFAVLGNFPFIQSVNTPQTWTFTYPRSSIPGSGGQLYAVMTMEPTTTTSMVVYEVGATKPITTPPPLRRWPPVPNNGFGPTRHHNPGPVRRAGGTY